MRSLGIRQTGPRPQAARSARGVASPILPWLDPDGIRELPPHPAPDSNDHGLRSCPLLDLPRLTDPDGSNSPRPASGPALRWPARAGGRRAGCRSRCGPAASGGRSARASARLRRAPGRPRRSIGTCKCTRPAHRLRRIRLGDQPGHPGHEPGRRVHLSGGMEPETVLVDAETPLVMRLEPGGVQADG